MTSKMWKMLPKFRIDYVTDLS